MYAASKVCLKRFEMTRKLLGFLVAAAAMLSACSAPKGEEAEAPEPVFGETYLTQLQPRDSVLIADQLRYGFRLADVALPEGELTLLPEAPACPGVRFLGEPLWEVDTLSVRGEGAERRYDLDAHLRVTSFDEGSYELPALGTVVGGDTLLLEGKTLAVRNCPVDTAKFAPGTLWIPATPIIRYPWTAAEKWRLTGLIAAVVAALALLGFGLWWLIRRKVRAAAAPAEEPAHIRALRKIDAFRGDAYWKPEKQKAFYSGITDALKEYIGERYSFDAPEMTSGEVLGYLKKKTDLRKDLRDGLGHLFEVADFVKFARHTVEDAENAGVVPFATSFVTATWQEVLEAEAAEKKEEGEKK